MRPGRRLGGACGADDYPLVNARVNDLVYHSFPKPGNRVEPPARLAPPHRAGPPFLELHT